MCGRTSAHTTSSSNNTQKKLPKTFRCLFSCLFYTQSIFFGGWLCNFAMSADEPKSHPVNGVVYHIRYDLKCHIVRLIHATCERNQMANNFLNSGQDNSHSMSHDIITSKLAFIQVCTEIKHISEVERIKGKKHRHPHTHPHPQPTHTWRERLVKGAKLYVSWQRNRNSPQFVVSVEPKHFQCNAK